MRSYENLNNNWFFSKNQFENIPVEITSNWEDISLPHTWNCCCCAIMKLLMKLSNEEAGMILVNAVSSISGISLNKSLLMMRSTLYELLTFANSRHM